MLKLSFELAEKSNETFTGLTDFVFEKSVDTEHQHGLIIHKVLQLLDHKSI